MRTLKIAAICTIVLGLGGWGMHTLAVAAKDIGRVTSFGLNPTGELRSDSRLVPQTVNTAHKGDRLVVRRAMLEGVRPEQADQGPVFHDAPETCSSLAQCARI